MICVPANPMSVLFISFVNNIIYTETFHSLVPILFISFKKIDQGMSSTVKGAKQQRTQLENECTLNSSTLFHFHQIKDDEIAGHVAGIRKLEMHT
jgi:hypothetical protein